jgi:hypothetical protein
MRIETLTESHIHEGRRLLRESCDGLTRDQRRIVEGIYNEFVPLIEATLTADQIKGIFKNVEQAAITGGDNRTLAGLGVDGVKQVNATINNVGKWLQNTTPVKMADEKFEQLKAKVGSKFPDLDKQLTGLGSWMKENPGKSAAIIGVLTALASLAGGPIGGAIAGQVLRGAAELIKGEKLSTAIGKGVKTAAYGAMAGWLLDGLGDWLEGIRAEMVPYDKVPGLVGIDVGLSKTLSMGGTTVKDTIYKIIVPEDLADTMMATVNAAKGGDVDAFSQLLDFSKNFSRADYLAGKGIMDAAAKTLALQNDAFLQGMTQANNLITAAAQGSIAGKMAAGDVKVDGKPVAPEGEKTPAKESWEPNYYLQTRPLSEGQVYLLLKKISTTEQLNEGPMDWIKKGAAAVGKGISRVGQNITNKVTYEKLLAGWKLDGSPTDSEELKKFLTSMEISDDIVNKVYTDMKLDTTSSAETPAATTGGYAEIKKSIAQLNTKDRQRMIQYLTKQIGKA